MGCGSLKRYGAATARRQGLQTEHGWFARCRRAADAPLGYFQAVFVYRIRQPENGLVLCGKHPISFNHASRADGGHLLFFASPKKSKQKKGDPDVQVCFADFPHSTSFFRRVRTSRAARAVGQRTLVSEKRMLRSAGRRGRGSSPKRLWWIDQNRQPEN